jgi:hypothetical protein
VTAKIAAIAASLAIGIGAFQQLYLRIHFVDPTSTRLQWTEFPYRRVPGLRGMLFQVEQRTPQRAAVLLWTPHRPWQGGYGYAFRRAQYVLAGRDVIPYLDRERDVDMPQNVARADYIACWPACPTFPGFEVTWRSRDGMLLRRVR